MELANSCHQNKFSMASYWQKGWNNFGKAWLHLANVCDKMTEPLDLFCQKVGKHLPNMNEHLPKYVK